MVNAMSRLTTSATAVTRTRVRRWSQSTLALLTQFGGRCGALPLSDSVVTGSRSSVSMLNLQSRRDSGRDRNRRCDLRPGEQVAPEQRGADDLRRYDDDIAR